MKKYYCILISLLAFSYSNATIINVPGDQPTIQEGINVAINGDTVLVQPGTYVENINFNGKNITVASLFLTTQDTTYISQTIIDGDSIGSVVVFSNGEDTAAVLCGLTMTHGYLLGGVSAGGISCYSSNPTLQHLIVTNNTGKWTGGGIYCDNSSPVLYKLMVSNNTALGSGYVSGGCGGGICCINGSNPELQDVTISENHTTSGMYDIPGKGGGIYCENSGPVLQNVTITNNYAGVGGGISLYGSGGTFTDVTITENSSISGGGMYCNNSSPVLQNVTISNNSASGYGSGSGFGGGIYCGNSSPDFNGVTISNNSASGYWGGSGFGGGIYCSSSAPVFDNINRCNIFLNSALLGNDLYSDTELEVVVDTFTVLYPTEFHSYPIENFSFDILNGKIEQVNADLYVSPEGDNTNGGLTADDPLMTIRYALLKIMADSLNPRTIHLLNGIYSPSTNEEFFPINMLDYISLSGESESEVILNAEGQSGVLMIDSNTETYITGLTITGGSALNGGGIECNSSNAVLQSITVDSNSATGSQYESNKGGGIFCNNSNPTFQNVTISNNSATDGGGIYVSEGSSVSLINCIFWNDSPQEICVYGINYFLSDITISWSDIEGGQEGIVHNQSGTVNWLNGNLDENPLFTGTGDHPYALSAASPCIDAGTPDTTGLFLPPYDIIGNPRIWNGRIDMGAYEWNNLGYEDTQINNENLIINNYPNPFSTSTTIEYELSKRGKAEIKIYNQTGQLIEQVVQEDCQKGKNKFIWLAKDAPPGIYFIRLQAGNEITAKKIIKL